MKPKTQVEQSCLILNNFSQMQEAAINFVNIKNYIMKHKKLTMKKNRSDCDTIEINEDFRLTLDLVDNSNSNLFVTGKAGTGKSTLLKLLKERTKKKCVVLAPTGLAALNIGGQTIHSFFKFPLNLINRDKIKKLRTSKLLKSLELLIIDEISMVRADLMDAIDYSLRINREIDKPFGGVQIILFGDMFQLPPVVKGLDLEMYFEDKYGGPYFFNAEVFNEFTLSLIELTKIYRQVDKEFIDDLNRIRENRFDENLLLKLNLLSDTVIKSETDNSILITTTNENANMINEYELSQIEDPEFIYQATIQGKFSEEAFPTEIDLRLKIGAQVIMLKNDQRKRWVNGTLAKISKLSDDHLFVKINGRDYKVELEAWENVEYVYDQRTRAITEKVVGSFEQFPLKLAWALTIHKSQGQTFDKVIIDLGSGAFTHGQTYVALSRCRSREGVILQRPIKKSDIIVDDRVFDIYSKFEMIN